MLFGTKENKAKAKAKYFPFGTWITGRQKLIIIPVFLTFSLFLFEPTNMYMIHNHINIIRSISDMDKVVRKLMEFLVNYSLYGESWFYTSRQVQLILVGDLSLL